MSPTAETHDASQRKNRQPRRDRHCPQIRLGVDDDDVAVQKRGAEDEACEDHMDGVHADALVGRPVADRALLVEDDHQAAKVENDGVAGALIEWNTGTLRLYDENGPRCQDILRHSEYVLCPTQLFPCLSIRIHFI